MIATDIINKAISLGACTKSGGVTDWKSLAWLFFSPQGEEFCANNNYPSIETFREIADDVRDMNVYVDAGKIKRSNDRNVAVIGHTEAELVYYDNTIVHKVIAMHGAKVRIIARNYAVVRVVDIGCGVSVNKDNTAVILE